MDIKSVDNLVSFNREFLEFSYGEGDKKSNCTISISNLTDSYLAFRVKTTLKDLYCVSPSHGCIEPNTSFDVLVILQVKHNLDSKDLHHKFLFEIIKVEKEETTKYKVKQIFEMYAKEQRKVEGYTAKKKVKINDENVSTLHRKGKSLLRTNTTSRAQTLKSEYGLKSNREMALTISANVPICSNVRLPAVENETNEIENNNGVAVTETESNNLDDKKVTENTHQPNPVFTAPFLSKPKSLTEVELKSHLNNDKQSIRYIIYKNIRPSDVDYENAYSPEKKVNKLLDKEDIVLSEPVFSLNNLGKKVKNDSSQPVPNPFSSPIKLIEMESDPQPEKYDTQPNNVFVGIYSDQRKNSIKSVKSNIDHVLFQDRNTNNEFYEVEEFDLKADKTKHSFRHYDTAKIDAFRDRLRDEKIYPGIYRLQTFETLHTESVDQNPVEKVGQISSLEATKLDLTNELLSLEEANTKLKYARKLLSHYHKEQQISARKSNEEEDIDEISLSIFACLVSIFLLIGVFAN